VGAIVSKKQKNTKLKLNLAFYPRPSHKAIPIYNSDRWVVKHKHVSIFSNPFCFSSLSSFLFTIMFGPFRPSFVAQGGLLW
jgi:hypothetical protein